MPNLTTDEQAKKARIRLANIKHLRDSFAFTEDELGKYLDSGMSYVELKKICLCAYLSKKSLEELVEMRKLFIWTRVLYLLGLDAAALEQGERENNADRIERIHGIDRKIVMKYQQLGFASHQIRRAYYLSSHCEKSIDELLEMKTRKKHWGDIAQELGLSRDACLEVKK